MRRTAPLEEQAAHAEREAFDHALAPYFSELLQAARREVRHRLTIGQFEPDNPTPEELLEKALQYAWRERRILSPPLGIKAWALASVFRTADALGAREAKRRRKMTECLPEELEPDPLYQQDDEDFWQLHELDHPRNAVVFSGPVDLSSRIPRTTMSLSAASRRASAKSCSCTRFTVWHCKRSRWRSEFPRPKRNSSYQAPGIACAPQATRRPECVGS